MLGIFHFICVAVLVVFHLKGSETKHICTSPVVSHPTISLPKKTTAEKVRHLRIILDYTSRFEKLTNAEDMKDLLIAPAVEYWSKAMKAVDAAKEPFYISKQCTQGRQNTVSGEGYCTNGCMPRVTCDSVPIPDKYLKCKMMQEGSPTITVGRDSNTEAGDILFLIDYRPTGDYCQDGTLVYAMPCVVNAEKNRPEVSYINFCKEVTDFDYPADKIALQAVRHQMAHALGFNAGLFAFMRDSDGQPRTERQNSGLPLTLTKDGSYYQASDKTLKQEYLLWETLKTTEYREVTVMVTPTVLREARRHYDCNKLEGVEMEDVGVKNNHFKKRVVMDELMSGVVTVDSKVSPLTLGYFADSGWYKVNMAKAEAWSWGSGLGCTFVQRSCYAYSGLQLHQNLPIRPWCDDTYSMETECLLDRSAFGTCNKIGHQDPLKSEFQYFDDPKLGGSDAYADYCPYIQTSEEDCDISTTICKDDDNQQFTRLNHAGQGFGNKALCLDHYPDQQWKFLGRNFNRTYIGRMATCHKYKCDRAKGLMIRIGNNNVTCQWGPEVIPFDTEVDHGRLTGSIICPPCSKICKTECPR